MSDNVCICKSSMFAFSTTVRNLPICFTHKAAIEAEKWRSEPIVNQRMIFYIWPVINFKTLMVIYFHITNALAVVGYATSLIALRSSLNVIRMSFSFVFFGILENLPSTHGSLNQNHECDRLRNKYWELALVKSEDKKCREDVRWTKACGRKGM